MTTQFITKLVAELSHVLKPHGIHPEDFILECVERVVGESNNRYERRLMWGLPCVEDMGNNGIDDIDEDSELNPADIESAINRAI